MSSGAQRAIGQPRTVALAISGHGFGHAVRSAEVARALLSRGARVKIRTDAPAWLFPDEAARMPSPGWPLDIGVAQYDGLDLDVDETRRRWAAFARDFDARTQVEAGLLVEHGVDIVLGDIPPLAFAAAACAGIPSVAMGNFGWDWIYAVWPDFEAIVSQIQTGYRQAELLLRLPLHSTAKDAFPAFGVVEDVPLIARRAARPRRDVRMAIGLPQDARVVLVSFGGFDARGLDLRALGRCTSYAFLLTPPVSTTLSELPPNVIALTDNPADYVSLLSACDAVITKPGYGIVADCAANHVAMLYTDRGPFREYDVLVQAMPTLCQARYVPRDEMLAGRLGPHLDALFESTPRHWPEQRVDGAAIVAQRVLGVGCKGSIE